MFNSFSVVFKSQELVILPLLNSQQSRLSLSNFRWLRYYTTSINWTNKSATSPIRPPLMPLDLVVMTTRLVSIATKLVSIAIYWSACRTLRIKCDAMPRSWKTWNGDWRTNWFCDVRSGSWVRILPCSIFFIIIIQNNCRCWTEVLNWTSIQSFHRREPGILWFS